MAIKYHSGRRVQGTSTDVATIYRGETPDTTTSSGNTIIKFLQSGTFTPTSAFSVNVLIVGGGGGGGISLTGGGGGGGVGIASSYSATAQDYTIVVGGGGAEGTSGSTNGTKGDTSSAFTQTITGGMGGAGRDAPTNPPSGANGGGASQDNAPAAGSGTQDTAISGFTTYGGNNGGSGGGNSPNYPGGGGAGAGANGGTPANSSSVGGAGGVGVANDFIGTNYYWGGGGGGSTYTGSNGGGAGGNGGGGGGSSNTGAGGTGGAGYTAGGNGVNGGSDTGADDSGGAGGANTGGGGGASSHSGGDGTGNGGSGIVVIKFATSGNTYDTSLGGKPTNVQIGSRWEETDTRKMYHYEVGQDTEENIFNSAFTTSGNASQTTATDPTGKIVLTQSGGSGNQANAYRTLSSISSSNKTFTADFTFKRNTGDLANSNYVRFASVNTFTSGITGNAKRFYFAFENAGYIRVATETASDTSNTFTDGTDMQAANTTKYYRFVGNGSTLVLTMYPTLSDRTNGTNADRTYQSVNFPSDWTTTDPIDTFELLGASGYHTGNWEVSDVEMSFNLSTNAWKEEGT